jgi:hypothetical protein
MAGRTGSAAAALLLALCLACPAQARVFLVGVDGASWNLLDPRMRSGELPHLAALAERGVTGKLKSVRPLISPTVWTSIATGRSPEVHGVTDFFATRLRAKVPSVFERLAASGLRVGLYDYLLTWPPQTYPGGFVIPGWLRRDASTTPPDVWERVPFAPYTLSYDGARTNADYLRRARREGAEKAKRWNALAQAYDLEAGAVTFYAVDATCHRFWEAAFPKDFESPKTGYSDEERGAIDEALRAVDRSVGEIAAQLGPDDSLVLVSDHGFRAEPEGGRSVWVAHFEDVLAQAGLDPKGPDFSLISTFYAVTLRVHPGDVAARDATAERLAGLLRSYRTPAGDPLFQAVEVIHTAPRPPGHELPWLTRLREWVVARVLSWTFGVTLDEKAHAIVFALPDDDTLAPLWPDGEVEVAGERMPLSAAISRQRFTGTHKFTGVFLAAGGPIAHVPERIRLSVLDVAPLLFYLAGRPIPDDLEGALPEAALDPEQLRAHPVAHVAASALPGIAEAPEAAHAGGGDAGLEEKLRALGYLE